MPNVLPALKGWRVVIFTNDHRPPHVHVIGAEEHARFALLCDLGQVQLMSTIGFSLRQLQLIADYLQANIAHLCNEWGRIHGHS
jgi:Domain of unknown function (DUF4160)